MNTDPHTVSVSYIEHQGPLRKHIEDRIGICVLLIDFYLQTDRINKVWSLLLKGQIKKLFSKCTRHILKNKLQQVNKSKVSHLKQ